MGMYNATSKQKRAAKGGEVGMNGLNYAGGTFLPNTMLGKMTRTPGSGSRKHRVAPYVWEVAPADGLVTLFNQFSEMVNVHTGAVNEAACRYLRRTPDEAVKMFAAWKAGIMWVAIG